MDYEGKEKLFTMNQVGTNLGISEGHPPSTKHTSYAGAAIKALGKSQSSSSPPSPRPLITKCDTFFRSPDIEHNFNMHIRSNIPRTLVFSLKRQHDPTHFHVALTTSVNTDTYRLVQTTTTGFRVDVCFQPTSLEQFDHIKTQGFTFEGTHYKPDIPVPDNANIIKVSLRHLPPHFSQKELIPLFNNYGTLLQAGRYYNECGSVRAFTGDGFILLQQNSESQGTDIPPLFNVGQHLRLLTRVPTATPPTNRSSEKPAALKGTTNNTQNNPPLSSNASTKNSQNDRKRNKRGKRQSGMEGIEVTGQGKDTTPLVTTNTGTNKASHIFFTEPEESGIVAPMQKTPPFVSPVLSTPPPPPPVAESLMAALAPTQGEQLRDQQLIVSDDSNDSDDSDDELFQDFTIETESTSTHQSTHPTINPTTPALPATVVTRHSSRAVAKPEYNLATLSQQSIRRSDH